LNRAILRCVRWSMANDDTTVKRPGVKSRYPSALLTCALSLQPPSSPSMRLGCQHVVVRPSRAIRASGSAAGIGAAAKSWGYDDRGDNSRML
jgi:hypothetical protein